VLSLGAAVGNRITYLGTIKCLFASLSISVENLEILRNAYKLYAGYFNLNLWTHSNLVKITQKYNFLCTF